MKEKGCFISLGVDAFEEFCNEIILDPSSDDFFPTNRHDGAMIIIAEKVDMEKASEILRNFFRNSELRQHSVIEKKDLGVSFSAKKVREFLKGG